MKCTRISKEIIWATGILFVCILAGLYLFINQQPQNTVPVSAEIISVSNTAELITMEPLMASDDIISASSENISVSDTASQTTDTFSTSDTTDITASNSWNEVPCDCPIDFASLWEINKDVYAWISIPGTIIDYPVLQHENDNSYYLNYTIDGIEGYPGSIYTEKVNKKDFSDNNTVIYGHNMRNGTMFTDLHKFRDSEFFAANDTVYIYTPEKQFTYKIFAAYLYDDRHLTNSFDFSDSEIYSDYLDQILTMDSEDILLRKDISVTTSDKIITLITCIREQPEKRVYVQAVLQP